MRDAVKKKVVLNDIVTKGGEGKSLGENMVYVILSNTLYSGGSITVMVPFWGSFIAPLTYFV